MDDRTVRDIELDKVLDGVRRYSLSPEGREGISPSLFTSDSDVIEDRAAVIDRYMSLSEGDAPDPFPPVRDIFSYVSRTHADLLGADIRRVGLFLASYISMLGYIGEEEDIHSEDKVLSDDILSSLDADGAVYEDHPRLRPLQRELERVRSERMRSAASFMHDNRDSIQQSEPLYRNERIVIPLRNDSKVVDNCYVSGSSSSGSTLFAEPFELVSLNNEAVIARERIQAEKARILHELSDRARNTIPFMKKMLERVIVFDFHHSFAVWAKRRKAHHPQRGEELSLLNAVHPLIGKDAVPITVRLDKGIKAVVFSGANAGGKTVTMKTIALSVALNQISGYITASELSVLPVFSSIYSDIGDGQSIQDAASTFSSHMKNIASITSRCDDASLVILDELGSGTDPEEGAALSSAILRYLASHACLTCITSHYSQMKSFAYSEENMMNASMEFDERSGLPTYRVLEGIPGDSHAVATAKRMGMPRVITEEASKALMGGEESSARIIKALLSKERTLDRKMTELSLKNREAERLRSELVEKEKKLDALENELRRDGVAELSSYLRSSRRTLENLISDIRTGKLTTEKIQKAKAFMRDVEKKRDSEESLVREEEDEVQDDRPFAPGDDILCGKAGTSGKVLEVNGNNLAVLLENGLRMTIKRSMARHARKEEPRKAALSFSGSSRKASYTIDLRGLTLEEALQRMDDQMEAAILAGMGTFGIIHGFGDGILSRGIHDYLSKRREVKDYYFARPEDGGMGKTYVELK